MSENGDEGWDEDNDGDEKTYTYYFHVVINSYSSAGQGTSFCRRKKILVINK